MLFHRIRLEAFCHATEDSRRVKEAILNLVPFKVEDGEFHTERLTGSFGNEIISLYLEFNKQGRIRKLTEFLRDNAQLGSGPEIDCRVTGDCEFWLRLDKQKAYEREIVPGKHDTVQLRGKVAAFPAKRENAIDVMRDFWG